MLSLEIIKREHEIRAGWTAKTRFN
jgi:hypothetical protein